MRIDSLDNRNRAVAILDATREAELRAIEAALERCLAEPHTCAVLTRRIQIVTSSAGNIEVSGSLGMGAKDAAPRCLMQFSPGQTALQLEIEEAA